MLDSILWYFNILDWTDLKHKQKSWSLDIVRKSQILILKVQSII